MARVRRRLAVAAVVGALLAGEARAERVRLLEDPRDAAQARVDLIRNAQREISALYFLARNDRITMTALALLRDAQRRGVKSRLLVDANFHHIPRNVLAHLRDEGVHVREYHPLTLRHPTWVIRRLHEKLVVVDAERYITGGRNLAEAYFGMARRNYADRDVFVEGESARDADAHFDRLWSSREVADLRVSASARERAQAAARLDEIMVSIRCGEQDVDWTHGTREVEAVRFMHDPDGVSGKRVGDRIVETFERATSSIVIESPYLVPSRALLEVLERKSRDGVYVQIVTNSFRSTDGLLPFAGYLKYRRRLIRSGIDVREFKGPDTLHAKSAVVDGRLVLIGSYNIDQRSHYLDLEGASLIDDAGLAREVLAAIGAHVEASWRVERSTAPPDERRMRIRSLFGLRAARLFLPLYEGQL